MPKKLSKEEAQTLRKAEGAAVSKAYEVRKSADGLQKSELAAEMDVTGGLITQWFDGDTRIPDLALLQLGNILGLDPYRVRPSLYDYLEAAAKLSRQQSLEIKGRLTPDEIQQLEKYAEFLEASRG